MTAKQIMHPADAKALQVLKQARGLNRLIKYYMEKGDECVARGENLGTMFGKLLTASVSTNRSCISTTIL